MLLENFTYPAGHAGAQRGRVAWRAPATSVTVLAPRGPGQAPREHLRGVEVRRYRTVWAGRSPWSYALEYGVAHVATHRALACRGPARRRHPALQRPPRHPRACGDPRARLLGTQGRLRHARLRARAVPSEVRRRQARLLSHPSRDARRTGRRDPLRPPGDRHQRDPARARHRARRALATGRDRRAQRSPHRRVSRALRRKSRGALRTEAHLRRDPRRPGRRARAARAPARARAGQRPPHGRGRRRRARGAAGALPSERAWSAGSASPVTCPTSASRR